MLVGAGYFGKFHLKDLIKLEREGIIILNGVVSLNSQDLKFAESLGAKIYPKLTDELLQDVDAVDIVTPPSTHAEITKKCLPHVNVFLEKPIALNAKEGLELYNLAKKTNHILFLGHIYRFHPVVQTLKKIIQESAQKPFFIECVFGDTPMRLPDDCGILYSDLHGFDIIDYLLEQEPKKITARGTKFRDDYKFEDNAAINLDYSSKLKGVVKLSWNTKPKTRKVFVHFSDKIVEADLISQNILIKKDGNAEKIKWSGEMPLALELRHFIKVLQGEADDYPNALVGTRIVNIAVHAEKSLHKGCAVNYMRADINFIHS